MRHNKRRTRFGKMDAHRKAMLSLMAKNLIIHQSIETTLVRAKEARRLAERLITYAKEGTLFARRKAFAYLRDEDVVKRLFNEIAPLFKSRVGGYTRIITLRARRGDGAVIALLEFTEKLKEEEPKRKQKAKEKAKKPVKHEDAVEKHEPAAHRAPEEATIKEKEEKIIEEVKKDRARKEDQKIEKKGFFKKFFRRKSGM